MTVRSFTRWIIFCLPWLFFITLAAVVSTKITLPTDQAILSYLHHFYSLRLDISMITITKLADPYNIMIVTGIVACVVWWKNRQADAIFLLLTVGGAMASNLLLKLIFKRSRPELWTHLVIETDFSFPSGHATISMAFLLALVFLAWPTKWRWPIVIIGTVIVTLIGFSRLYVGVHYPSDILAGWLVSLSWVSLIWLLGQHYKLIPTSQHKAIIKPTD